MQRRVNVIDEDPAELADRERTEMHRPEGRPSASSGDAPGPDEDDIDDDDEDDDEFEEDVNQPASEE